MEPIGRHPQYDAFADEFVPHATHGLYNAHIDRPACLALLGDVHGRHVLDAACGPGLYARELLERGATVTGLDQSPRMIELARTAVPGAGFEVHDLADTLPLRDNSVDLVLFALAYEYLDDPRAVFTEFHRVLRPAGALVMSRLHPTGDWLRHGGDYFAPSVVEETWENGWHVRYRLAPLQDTADELFRAGFLIERLVEPRPDQAAAASEPDRFGRVSTEPISFLALRAIPDPRR